MAKIDPNNLLPQDQKDPVMFRVFNEIGIVEQLATAQLEKLLPYGIKSSQFGILNHLVRLGDGTTHQRLTAAFQVTKGAMTNNLNRLNDKGLIRISPDPDDGRIKRIYLTELGQQARQEAIEKVGKLFASLLGEFTEQEFADALPFLTRLRMFLDQNRNLE